MRSVRGFHAIRAADSPHGGFDPIALCPTFALVSQLHAVTLFSGLQVKTTGAHFLQQCRKEKVVFFPGLDNQNRRIHSSRDKQRAAAEGIAEKQLIVFGIEKVSPCNRNFSARHAAQNRGDGFNRPAHFRGGLAFHERAVSHNMRFQRSRSFLLVASPNKTLAANVESIRRRFHGHQACVKRICVFEGVDTERKLEVLEGH